MTKKKKIAKKKTAKKKKEKTTPAAGPAKPAEPEPVKSPVVEYPTAGAKITDFESVLDNQLAGGNEPPPKRGRGRPRKDSTPAPPAEITLDENIISQAFKVPFDLWASTNNLPSLKLSDQDARILAGPVKQLIDYYLPNIPTITIAWVSLAVTAWAIMAPRMVLIAQVKKQKAEYSSRTTAPAGNKNQGPDIVANPGTDAQAPAPVVFPGATEPVEL